MLASLEKSVGSVAKGIWLSSSAVISSRLYSQTHRHKNYTSQNSTELSTSSSSGGDGGRMDRRRGRGSGGRQSSMRHLDPIKMNDKRALKKGQMQSEKEMKLMNMNMTQYRQEFRQEIKEFGDPMDEPDPDMLTKSFDDYLMESQQLKDRIKTRRMTKKHYGDDPRELCLLTWAERENIRYLHETDPEQWTPETLAEAYPISPDGVFKVLKSSFRLRTINEVKKYDAEIALRIKNVKSGAISMNENLEKRLKIRELIPLRVGDLGLNPHQYVDTSLPAKLGQFASLVAPRDKGLKKEVPSLEKPPVVKYMSDGDFFDPDAVNNPDNTGALEPELSKQQLRKIMPARLMTFSEFERRMEAKEADKKAGDMKYMLGLQKQTTIPQSLPHDEIELPHDGHLHDTQVVSNVEKYRKPEETGQVEVHVEGKQGYVYQPETGYQKPYESSNQEFPERISIPEELWRPGATYKVGECYYDENGEFLYRVF